MHLENSKRVIYGVVIFPIILLSLKKTIDPIILIQTINISSRNSTTNSHTFSRRSHAAMSANSATRATQMTALATATRDLRRHMAPD